MGQLYQKYEKVFMWRGGRLWYLALPLFFSAVVSLACGGFSGWRNPLAEATPTPAPTYTPVVVSAPADLTNAQVALIDELGLDFAERRVIEVYERVSPSVVNVNTEILQQTFFFRPIPTEGAGSGFVIDREGHILTNFHVVEGAQSIEVTFIDDTSVPATVVGVDPRNDVAVLKVDAPPEKLQPVELGTSADLQVGQRSIAIGNPFGQFDNTLTTGVISALGRSLEGPDGRTISGVIQTDAAINSGNSGGPLLNSNGQVIGINTAIFSPSGASAGVGFAVPIDTVRRMLPDLLTIGRYRHPDLGIEGAYSIRPGFARSLNLPVESGLLLVQLYPGGPLERAGVLGAQREVGMGNRRVYVGGDILTAVDGTPITGLDGLETLLANSYQVGDTVTVSLIRNGNPFEVTVQLAEQPR
jgi:S1-C subfamily serine protease